MLIDHHVHLGLVDVGELAASDLDAVVDLGWSDDVADLAHPDLQIRYAGRFLAAPGGYPADRDWAPADGIRVVAGPADAEAAVAEQCALGAAVIKLTLHAGHPVPDEETSTAIVAAAASAGRDVVAHAEGPGMVERSLAAGVAVLAHTPWTERLPDAVIAEAAGRQAWISTLDIHGYGDPTPRQRTAIHNLRRFHAAGGRVLYGTDLGNGPLPLGLNQREIALLDAAGLDDRQIRRTLADPWPEGERP